MVEVKGVIPAMVTLFKKNEELDEEGIRAEIEYLIEGGVHGILVVGSIGEFMHLSMDERKKVAEIGVDQSNGRVPIFVHVGDTSTRNVIELGKHAEDIGADGLTVVTPYYFLLSDEELYQYYKDISDAVDIPVLIYNFTAATKIIINPQVVARLADDCDNIVGIKDSIDSLLHMISLIKIGRRKKFAVLAGSADYLLAVMQIGGHGTVSGVANFYPKLPVEIYESYVAGDVGKAVKLYWKLIDIREDMFKIRRPPIPVFKEALNQLGRPATPTVRKPILPLNEEEKRRVSDLLTKAGLQEST